MNAILMQTKASLYLITALTLLHEKLNISCIRLHHYHNVCLFVYCTL